MIRQFLASASRSSTVLLLLLCGAALTASQPSFAKTIYVNVAAPSSGNGTLETPYNSFFEAVKNASPGDTLAMANGIYFEDSPAPAIPATALPLSLTFYSPSAAVPAGSVTLTPADPTDCFRWGPEFCPTILPAHDIGVGLEPSGLVYLPDHKIWVAVSDNYDDLALKGSQAASYAIFGFTDDRIPPSGVIRAFPLLSTSDSLSYPLYDLEGLAGTPAGGFYATGSLALDRTEGTQDRWYRFQMLRFQVGSPRDGYVLRNLEWVSANYRRDLREWLISSSGYPWTIGEVQSRAEQGGINVEALGVTGTGDLLLGLRGPGTGANGNELMILEITPASSEQTPVCKRLTTFSPKGGKSPFGFRGLEAVPGYPGTYVYLIGPRDMDYNPFYAGIGVPNQVGIPVGILVQVGTGQGLVPEGIAVKSVRAQDSQLRVLVGMVDDLKGRFMMTYLTGPKSSGQGPPFVLNACTTRPVG